MKNKSWTCCILYKKDKYCTEEKAKVVAAILHKDNFKEWD